MPPAPNDINIPGGYKPQRGNVPEQSTERLPGPGGTNAPVMSKVANIKIEEEDQISINLPRAIGSVPRIEKLHKWNFEEESDLTD